MEKGLLQTMYAATTGEIEAEVYEIGGTAPKRVIRSDQEWEVRVNWQLCGDIVPLLDDENRWHLHINIESMGPGPEKTYYVGERRFGQYDEKTPNGCYKYHLTKRFGEDAIEPSHEGALFRVFVTLTSYLKSGTPGPFAGFVELKPIQIFRVPE